MWRDLDYRVNHESVIEPQSQPSALVRAAQCPTARCPIPNTTAARTLCGGCSAVQPTTGEIQSIPDMVKPQLEEKANKRYPLFKAMEFKSQLVAGTNYFIKIQVDNDDFVYLRVFKSLPCENAPLALHSYQTNKTKNEALTYF
ncbi:PREDICTED: LOW QUALITY PROTEIN: cystatin-B-like [Hipposideros armiger]|uniref:LOW QUALITY PROTEIN: cystatin-B-like n=1 Tax=Hipposideros armiger TaxID=186990 RepID=A0A8B7SWC6_HIPAR|nr:PREDICTED: LOW QUALITY PROTEIN: cystatin-B-like [Hipposideros armiger]